MLQCNNYDVVDLGVMVPSEKILETAREEKADIIGLSGLITPSLDRMVDVAAEMKREGFDMPLLIGGATTSKKHTAIKIAPEYEHGVIHVDDASKAVGVVSNLLSADRRGDYLADIEAEQQKVRDGRPDTSKEGTGATLEEARANAFDGKWDTHRPVEPAFKGEEVFARYDVGELVDYIDWTPFFHAWELKGRYPAILDDERVGEEARALFDDAQQLLRRIVDEGLFTARGVLGLFPANAVGDDVEVYTDESRRDVRAVLHHLRQQTAKPPGRANLCLADFVAPVESGLADWVGAFCVTAGHGVDDVVRRFEAEHDDYQALLAKALADRLAEAFAERLHQRVREEFWGYASDEGCTNEQLIAEQYVGIRPAPGYPACPDHTEKRTLFALLDASEHTGMTLTESYAMHPAASVSGWYLAHPDAFYFGVGKIARDQVEDYAGRKGTDPQTVEQWLAPNLAYERDEQPVTL